MRILFIQTGGTIDKDYPKQIKGRGFEITTPAFGRVLSKLKLSFEYTAVTLSQKDSQNISDADFNLGMAVVTVQNFQEGVFVCLNGMVCSAEEIKRNMHTGKFLCE